MNSEVPHWKVTPRITLVDGPEGTHALSTGAVGWLPLPLENCPRPNGSHMICEFKRLESVTKATDTANFFIFTVVETVIRVH